ncbi:hypothetical protein GH733_007312 [Mirounga leonina]|nr:hypothetical protein GH733_007312 [Mirounga leonina]
MAALVAVCGVTFNPNPGDNKRLSLRLNLKPKRNEAAGKEPHEVTPGSQLSFVLHGQAHASTLTSCNAF